MTESTDATTPKPIITDPDAPEPGAGADGVPEAISKLVDEYERTTGQRPEQPLARSTRENPRAHLPKYPGKMRGELPDDHPERQRQVRAYRAMRKREAERDAAVRAAEATVPQKIRVGAKVAITGNAKVDYEDEGGVRVKGDYGGIEGEVFQTYVDHEGVRRHIIVDRDPSTGRSRFAPVAVRECDLVERGSEGRRVFAVKPAAQNRADVAQHRAAMAGRSQEDIERAAFGGKTAKELADLMCGL